MLDNKKILCKITQNKNFSINILQPFNKLSMELINDFSDELKKEKKTYKYLDLIYLSSWCSKKKIQELKNRHFFYKKQIGRGLAFHITPSNVPTNFIYSFFFGLLSGNSNIVKLPAREFPEKKIILDIIIKIFKRKKYINIKNSNYFILYNKLNNSELTEKLSSICDVRIIWGGDKTINEVRKIWIPERATELTFADRYSFSIVNSKKLKNLNELKVKNLIKNFFYDTYTMNQLACNSPHFLFWIGKNNKILQNKFWNSLNIFAKKRFNLDEKNLLDKYTNLVSSIFTQNKFKNLRMFDNTLYVVDPNKDLSNIENIRGKSGTFFQKNINNIAELKKYVTKKCQTITYFGFNKKEIESFLFNNNLKGVDRIVPIGSAMEIDIIWDGYNVINSLSREISIQ